MVVDKKSDTLPSKTLKEAKTKDNPDFAVGNGIDKSFNRIMELIGAKELMDKELTSERGVLKGISRRVWDF